MLTDIVYQQKLEKEQLLEKTYIPRSKLTLARKYLDNPNIKIITGPRRAGKSVFSLLLLQEKNFAYLNFDDENLIKVNNYDDLLSAVFTVYPNTSYFLFDEIQNLPNWELFVNKLHRRGHNLLLTGSNSKLLSGEMATSLTGRYLTFEILPFSFAEFLLAKKQNISAESQKTPEETGRIYALLNEYMQFGGYPEIATKQIEPKSYLKTLFDAILFKDIVKRYRIRFPQQIYDLSVYLMTNFANEYSFGKLRKILNFRSTATVQNYLHYLEETYLFFSLNRYSYKVSQQIKSPRKMYVVDNGLISGLSQEFSPNSGKRLENLIFGEIIKRDYQPNKSLFSYKCKSGKEIDYVLKKDLKIEKLLQVWYNQKNTDSAGREIKALLEGSKELDCSDLEIITWDKEDVQKYNDQTIKFTPVGKFLTSPA